MRVGYDLVPPGVVRIAGSNDPLLAPVGFQRFAASGLSGDHIVFQCPRQSTEA